MIVNVTVHMIKQLIRAVLGLHLDGDLSDCPAYHGKGVCESGCYEEPGCITDVPYDGWPSERNLAGRIRWVLRGEEW